MGKKEKHPAFPNPTVAEAIIEVYLSSPLTDGILENIFNTLKSVYPKFNREQLVSYQAALGESGMSISQENLPGQLRLQFRDVSNNFLIQIFPDRISVHRIANYDRWDSLIDDFSKTWDQIKLVANESSIQRVGVRFINRLNEKNIEDSLKTWLKPSPFYPEILLNCNSGFFFRGQWTSMQKNNKLRTHIVSIAEGGIEDENTHPLMFDIDVVQTCYEENKNSVFNLADELHEEIWNIFINSVSENYLKILNKEI